MEIEKMNSNIENKLKYIAKEFGLNFSLFFLITFIISIIFLLIETPNQEIFWQMIFCVSTGIFAVSLINAISLLPVDIFIKNKKINLSLSFFPFLIIMLVIYFGDKKEMLTENLIKFSIGLAIICLTVNYFRYKRLVNRNNASY
jgi:MFS family permease